jgi:DNA polymerase-3 subunit epsilon
VPIHPEAQAIHGISAADLEMSPTFDLVCDAIRAGLAAADVIVGYNVAFDLDIVQADLARAGHKPLELQGKHVVDVLRLWHHVEPRTLAAAHEKFCGEALTNAHAATADVAATARVLTSMIQTFGLTDKAWAELAAIADPFPGRENWIGPSNHLQWSAGVAVFAFGKHKGRPIADVDAGFLRWVIDKDFPPHVKDVCRAALVPSSRAAPSASFIPRFEDWLAQRYPRAT